LFWAMYRVTCREWSARLKADAELQAIKAASDEVQARKELQRQLQAFYTSGSSLETELLSDKSDDAVNSVIVAINKWENNIARWLSANMTDAAIARFKSLSHHFRLSYPSTTPNQNEYCNRLVGFQKNLEAIMNTDAFYK